MGATAFDAWSKAHQTGHFIGDLDTFGADPANFLERFLTQDECWVHHFEPEAKRQPSGNTPLLPLQRRPSWYHRQGRWWPPSSEMQNGIVFLDYLQKGKLSMGNAMPTCQSSCERQSSQNGLENWRSPVSSGPCSCTLVCGCNGYCAWLQLWSPSIFSWFGTIWLFFCSQNENNNNNNNNNNKLGWEAISDRWSEVMSAVED